MPDNEKFVEGVAKNKIQARINNYNEILNSDVYDKESYEYIYAQDVIEEITNLLKKADDSRSFVDSIDIKNRIERYLKELEYIDKHYLESKKEELEEKIEEIGEVSSIDVQELTVDEILAEIDRIASLDITPPTFEEIQEWKSSRPKSKVEIKSELDDVLQAIEELERRDSQDVNTQKRVIKHRISELEEINKGKELFKINEKGEATVNYPDIELDKEAIMEAAKKEYISRRQDMLDKFYGNKAKGKEYSEKYKELQSHIKKMPFEYIDKDGNVQKSTYLAVEEYEGMEEALTFLQLEEYPERLKRLTKAEAGDLSVYKDVHVRNEDGKFIKLSEENARKADEQYIETNNNAYNKLVSTRDNLKTLGKYGEKVDYTKFQKGQPIRNFVRAAGNVAKFVRNHVTAPVNKFVGSKIISPIYGVTTGADKKVAGLYANKRTHRYVARREYFESQGKGYFSSRFNSIFNAKEGNKAILSAGAYDIQQSLIKKYTELAKQEAMKKQTEFASKSIEDKIEMIKKDLDKATVETDKVKLQATLADLEKAKVQIARDRQLNEKTAITQTIQTDAVDISQHDIANKENVTRTITGIKLLSRLGIRKLVGPKIKEWLMEHTTKIEPVRVKPTPEEIENALDIKDQKWVPSTYKEGEVPVFETRLKEDASMSEIMSGNAGKQVEGYYSVYSGEARPAIYELKGNEKITGIFQKNGEIGGNGLSDTAGLRAPTLTDGTFASDLLDANGVLKQDTTLDQILNAVGNGSIKPEELTNVYVSVGDRYWTKLSDLCQNVTEQVQVGTEVSKVIDVEGHFETLTAAEKVVEVEKALKEALNKDPQFIQKLSKVTTEPVENPRVTNVLKGLGIAYNVVDNTLVVDDAYENVRRTDTNFEWEKPEDRQYDYKTKFTGSKKQDIKKASKDERDER